MTTLIIARHGNTFGPHEAPRRVGAATDLPLVASGRRQAVLLGRYLLQQNLVPHAVFCSRLKRTRETAAIILRAAKISLPLHALRAFNEIDHGPDENALEAYVLARIGREALHAWEAHNIPPQGWRVNPAALTRMWRDFGKGLQGTVLVITSGGVARFAPCAAGKLATGAFGILRRAEDGTWACLNWNIRPNQKPISLYPKPPPQ